MAITHRDFEEEDCEDPNVPAGVIEGIRQIAEGDTASKDDIESVLKF